MMCFHVRGQIEPRASRFRGHEGVISGRHIMNESIPTYTGIIFTILRLASVEVDSLSLSGLENK